MGRIDREKKIIKLMIDIYCHKKHGNNKGELCEECAELLKEKVKEVMKFSGPRLIIYNPVELVRHALNK